MRKIVLVRFGQLLLMLGLSASVTDKLHAANANLFVSAENSQFDNYMSALQVIEVVVIDSDVNDVDRVQSEPLVTVNGFTLRMVQAVDGNWYGYFADLNAVKRADATTQIPGIGLDYGVLCSQETDVGVPLGTQLDVSEALGIAVPGAIGGCQDALCPNPLPPCQIRAENHMNVLRAARRLNQNPNIPSGQIGLHPDAWPFIQLYALEPAGNVIIQYSKGGGVQTTELMFDTVEEFVDLERDRATYPRGAEVHLTITDPALNVDPTDEDSWTFATNSNGQLGTYYYVFDQLGQQASDKVGDGTINVLGLLQDFLFENGSLLLFPDAQLPGRVAVTLQDNLLAAIRSEDLEDPLLYFTDGSAGIVDGVDVGTPVAGALGPGTQLITVLERGPNSGVFATTGADDVSGVRTVRRRIPNSRRPPTVLPSPGSGAIVGYNNAFQAILIFFETAQLNLLANADDPWLPRQERNLILVDDDANKNSRRDEDLDVFDAKVESIPTIKIGNPSTLSRVRQVFLGDTQLHVEVEPMSERALLTHFGPDPIPIPDETRLRFVHRDVTELFNALHDPQFQGFSFVHFDLRALGQYFRSLDHVDVILSDGTNSVTVANAQEDLRVFKKVTREQILPLEGSLSIDVILHVKEPETLRPEQILPVTLDFLSFGVSFDGETPRRISDYMVRIEAEETNDNTGVFEGELQYFVLNQFSVLDESTYLNSRTHPINRAFTGDDPVLMVPGPMVGDNALDIRYSDLGADGATHTISHREDIFTHSGAVELDSHGYRPGDVVTVTLRDQDLNDTRLFDIFGVVESDSEDPAAGTVGQAGKGILPSFGPLGILMTVSFDGQLWKSDTPCGGGIDGPDGLASTGLFLIETGKDTGIYAGSFRVPETFCDASTGQIRTTEGATLQVEYRDFVNAEGAFATSIAQSRIAPKPQANAFRGRVCDESAALMGDGDGVGLGYRTADGFDTIDGQNVTACLQVDFGQVQPIVDLRVVARAADATCGAQCSPGSCGTGSQFKAFRSVDGKAFQFVAQRDVTTQWTHYYLPVQADLRFALICRSRIGSARPHVEIDFVDVNEAAPVVHTLQDTQVFRGRVCEAEAILEQEGVAANLAYATIDGFDTIDGRNVTGCVRADFGQEIVAPTLRVVARSVQSACGVACSGDSCGTGQQFRAFSSLDGESYRFLDQVPITDTFASYWIPLKANLRYALICRSRAGSARNHVAIDYLEALSSPLIHGTSNP